MAVLTSPTPKATLLLYILASSAAVSAALVEERQDLACKKQCLIYFVSEALSGAKKFYSETEKMAYAVIMASKKLKHYFQAHPIIVPIAFPVQDMFKNKESSGRLAKWSAELSQYVVDFVARTTIKSQVLADFVADLTPSENDLS